MREREEERERERETADLIFDSRPFQDTARAWQPLEIRSSSPDALMHPFVTLPSAVRVIQHAALERLCAGGARESPTPEDPGTTPGSGSAGDEQQSSRAAASCCCSCPQELLGRPLAVQLLLRSMRESPDARRSAARGAGQVPAAVAAEQWGLHDAKCLDASRRLK
jgi:hypothetical protein